MCFDVHGNILIDLPILLFYLFCSLMTLTELVLTENLLEVGLVKRFKRE